MEGGNIEIEAPHGDDDDFATAPSQLCIIPPGKEIAIRRMLERVWECDSPRSYQLEALYHLLFKKEMEMMYLIRKTGEGKSLVLLGMATLMKGVTLSMVPLLGLGSDQSQKASETSFIGFEAHHIDEYRDEVADKLMSQLKKYSSEQKTAILLYISPQLLQPTSKWYSVFETLARRGDLSAVCIDEVHAAVQNYVSFRPEFKSAVESLNSLVSIAKAAGKRVPILAMSATFTIPQQRAFNKLIQRKPSMVIWGDMDKRNVGFHTVVAGNPMQSLIKDWIRHTKEDPRKQSLIYSNSKAACDGQIMNSLVKACQRLPRAICRRTNKWRFIALTGACGVMLKSFIVESFCRNQPANENDDCSSDDDDNASDDNSDGSEDGDEPEPSARTHLPKIWCMPCTSAANCGVSSNMCTKCYRLGPPPNFHDLVQEMGRVDRSHDATHGEHGYYIHFNLQTFISLWLRIQAEPVRAVKLSQEVDLMEVLRILVLPERCYHDAIEKYFENPQTHASRGGCKDNCSYCTEAYKNISGPISKPHLTSTLTTHVFDKGAITLEKLIAFFSSKAKSQSQHKKNIWRVAPSNVTAGQVHGLLLMLLAGKIIKSQLTEPGSRAVGKRQLILKDVEFVLEKETTVDEESGEGYEVFSYSVESNWELFNFDLPESV